LAWAHLNCAASGGSFPRRPLLDEDCVHPGVGPLPFETEVLTERRLVPHPQPQAERNRRRVAWIEFRAHPVQANGLESKFQQGVRGLGCVAVAKEIWMQRAADFALQVGATCHLQVHMADYRLPWTLYGRRIELDREQ